MTTTQSISEAARADKPKVQGEVVLRREVDFCESLDGWTLAEIDNYLDGDDDEGMEVLAADAYVIASEVDDLELRRNDLVAYAEWRRSHGLTGRLA